jgi:recombination protein RecR
MLDKLPAFTQLLKTLQQVPYLSSKNLYRVADYFLSSNKATVEKFCTTLLMARNSIKPCPICFCWYEVETACLFCSSTVRDQKTVCVVETWQEMLAIEKTNGYSGVYHVLGGVIYPLEGIGPDDLTIEPLIKRVVLYQVEEIILATNQTPEGEATAMYIARKLKESGVRVSCLARGLPVGSSLEAMDRLTVFKALSERRLY